MELSIIIGDIFNSWGSWAAAHGGRVVLILAAAVLANVLVRFFLSRKRLMPVIDNIPRPNYKNIIGKYERRRVETVVKALNNTLAAAVWVVALITLLPEFGVNMMPVLAGLGLAGAAAALAAKDMLTDFVAGFFIIVEGEYNIGDKVKIGGVTGKVIDISLRRTILEGKAGAVIIIPNREIKLIKRFAGRKREGQTVEPAK